MRERCVDRQSSIKKIKKTHTIYDKCKETLAGSLFVWFVFEERVEYG